MLTAGPQRRPARAWAERLTPVTGSTAAVVFVFLVALAMESSSPAVLVAAVPTALAASGVLLARRRGCLPERPWDGGRPAPGPRPPAPGGTGGGPEPEPPGPGATGSRTPWRVVAALGRIEARELVCSPWFGVGVGLQLWLFLSFGVLYADEDLSLWSESIQLLVAFSHPLVGMTVVAAPAATTRARHDDSEELYVSCPAGAGTRTLGLLSTAWVPAVSLAGFLLAFLGTAAVNTGQVYGPAGRDAVPDIVGAVVLGAGGVALGVAVGRWASSRLAPVVAVLAVGALSLRMATGAGGWTVWSQLSTFRTVRPELFVHRGAWWHVAWLLGLTTAVVGLALAGSGRPDRSGPPRRAHRVRAAALVIGGLGTAVALAAGVLATRPMPASAADRIADRVARPAASQSCAPAGLTVRVCAYRGYGEVRDRIVAEVTPVAAALPAGVGPVTLRQVYPGDIEDLPPEVVRRLPGSLAPLPSGEVALSLEPAVDHVVSARYLLAFAALGLPTEPEQKPGTRSRPLVVSGQARGVVALWLAARGLPPGAAAELVTANRRGRSGPPPPGADAFDRGFAWPTSCESAPVVWSAQDLTAARALLRQPADRVSTLVADGWERWRHPATGTDELLAAAGVSPAGPFDQVVTRDPGSC